MALEKLALIIVIAFAAVWCGIVLVGAIAIWPIGLLVLIVFAIVGYFIYRVVRDRLSSAQYPTKSARLEGSGRLTSASIRRHLQSLIPQFRALAHHHRP